MAFSTSRRRALSVLGVTAVAVALAGCTSATPSASGPTTITVWERGGGFVFDPQVKAFEKAHPDIKVKLSSISYTQYLTKLANSVRAGTTPDVISFDIVNTPLLAQQGILLDITDRVKAMPDLKSIAPAGVAIGELDGKNYALPNALTGSQMFWNKSLFKRAGLDPDKAPASLEEVKADAEKIKALGGGVSGFSTLGGTGGAWTGFPSAWAAGGNVLTAASKTQTATFTDPAVVGMLSWYQDMWKSGLMQKTDEPNVDPGNVGQQNALAGKVGIVFSGANVFSAQKDKWGSAVGIPGVGGGQGSFLGGDETAVTSKTKNAAAAWTFVNWMVTSKQAATLDSTQGWIAPDLDQAKQLAADDWTKNIVSTLAIGKLPTSIAYNAIINDSSSPWSVNSENVIFQGGDPQASMQKAQTQADSLIKDAYTQLGQ